VAEANATIAGYLFAAAKARNIAAIIFWLKTRAHWRERNVREPVPSANGQSNGEVLLLPDNSQDPELIEALREAQEKFFAGKRQERWLS
jgi:hypothetical protein